MEKHDAMSIGQVIEQAIAMTGNRDDYDRQRACYVWEEVVGPAINRYTTCRWMDRDKLHVCIVSAPLKNELQFTRRQLVDNINRALGKTVISDIIIH